MVLELARANGLPLEFRDVTEAEVRGADEIWVTSSSKEVLADRASSTASRSATASPGPVFRRMHALYQDFKQKVMRAGQARGACPPERERCNARARRQLACSPFPAISRSR